jgi:hypothetical protein
MGSFGARIFADLVGGDWIAESGTLQQSATARTDVFWDFGGIKPAVGVNPRGIPDPSSAGKIQAQSYKNSPSNGDCNCER